MDSKTEDKARLTPEASGIRKPPRPPLRVGLAMEDRGGFCYDYLISSRLGAALKSSAENFWMDGNSSFDLGSIDYDD
ncbi:hypothetical protein ACFL2Z_03150 [Candidatus Eisenbacteria bacterium]|uniref:Uncharacterized protein n=1 Tax=Eiseniibacteriota bacterium TaxID=2212470 RepID=A0ABV6YPD4_UNCEI